ncbi:MAG: hypothetical protein JWQ59_2312 [Cryobacterium sp.]|jgi:hypothetical protein|nr:hypothetical protein [Cryobacterium sp.]
MTRPRTLQRRRRSPHAALAVSAATLGYLANCALGTGVRLRVIDTSGARWVHHALYITTSVLTVTALGASAASRNPAGWWLLPAVVPLAGIPFAGTRSWRHPVLGLAAAPFFVSSALRVWR